MTHVFIMFVTCLKIYMLLLCLGLYSLGTTNLGEKKNSVECNLQQIFVAAPSAEFRGSSAQGD